jgi:hydroxyacylglutathione hydrolase
MAIEIKGLNLGAFSTNAYIIGDTVSGKAIVIDPVDRADLIQGTAQESGWTIELILATHAHLDHVIASKDLKAITGAPFWTHENSVPWLEGLPGQGRMFGLGELPEAAKPDRLLGDDPISIEIGAIRLETIFTPGHAPDHIAYLMRDEQILFGGDTIFEMSVGRVDLPGADPDTFKHSIVEKLLPLGDEVRILPGHMNATTIGRERQHNPFVREFLADLS